MKIAVDLRSLSSGTVSGVENYTQNLLANLLKLDKVNEYVLFYNSLGRQNLPDFHYVNSRVVYTHYPNKLLNSALKFDWIKMERLLGDFDWLFIPNLNQFSISHRAKLAITVHDLSPVVTPEFYDVKRRLWHKFLNYRQAFNRADVLFAVSQYTKNDLVRIFGLPEQKIKVIYPGIGSEFSHPGPNEAELRRLRNFYGLPGKFILFLNTIEPRKNLAGLVKAFENLQGPEFLVIAGRLGWKYSRDFDLIKKSKKSAKIRYIGYIDETDKPALIKLARALIYPSFYEGFGFQPLEAMALGTPVAASQLTSLPEVVGRGGLLINPYDPGSLTRGISSILSSPALRQKLIDEGLSQAEKFSWQTSAANVLRTLTL